MQQTPPHHGDYPPYDKATVGTDKGVVAGGGTHNAYQEAWQQQSSKWCITIHDAHISFTKCLPMFQPPCSSQHDISKRIGRQAVRNHGLLLSHVDDFLKMSMTLEGL